MTEVLKNEVKIDASTYNWNAGGMTSITSLYLARYYANTAYHSNMIFKELIVRRVVDTADNEALIYDYLKTKY